MAKLITQELVGNTSRVTFYDTRKFSSVGTLGYTYPSLRSEDDIDDTEGYKLTKTSSKSESTFLTSTLGPPSTIYIADELPTFETNR